jgi:hypothetical protein
MALLIPTNAILLSSSESPLALGMTPSIMPITNTSKTLRRHHADSVGVKVGCSFILISPFYIEMFFQRFCFSNPMVGLP